MSEKRKLCAIMFVDIVGYTALMGKNQSEAIRAVYTFRKVLQQNIARYQGELIKELGDGAMMTFQSSTAAASCALGIQNQLADESFSVRIGVHLGDVIVSSKDVYGDGVNITSRIESSAKPATVVVSDSIAKAISGYTNFELASLGERVFKNVTTPVSVYQLTGKPLVFNAPPRISRKARLSIAAVAVLAIAAVSWWQWPQEHPIESDSGTVKADQVIDEIQEPKSADLAVLPFQNLSNDTEQDFFADGLSEEIILTLSRIKELRVSARTSSFQFRNNVTSPNEIAEQLGVRYLITGTVRRSGDRLRISTELMDVSEGTALWFESFDRTISADVIFDIQDDIAQAVSLQIPELLALGTTHQTERGTENLAAYEAYLRAREIAENTMEGHAERRRWYQIAIELDPDFVEAQVAYSQATALSIGVGYLPFEETMKQVETHVSRYMAEGYGERVDVLRLAGYVEYLKGNVNQAEQYYLTGLEKEPDNLDLIRSMISILDLTARNDLSQEYRVRAFEIDPLNPRLDLSYAFHYMYSGQFQKQLEACQRIIDRKSGTMSGYYCMFNYHSFVTYEFGKAMAMFYEIAVHSPHTHVLFNAATLLNYMHETDFAEQWWSQILEPYYRLAKQGTSQWIDGDADAAEKSLAKAWDAGRQQTALTPYAQILLSQGKYNKAIELVSGLSSYTHENAHLDRTQLQAGIVLAYSFRETGREPESEHLLKRILQRTLDDDIVHRGIYGIVYTRAEVLALLGRTEEALAHIQELQAQNIISMQHSTLFSYTPDRNPYYESIRHKSEFTAWLEHLETQRDAMRESSRHLFDFPSLTN